MTHALLPAWSQTVSSFASERNLPPGHASKSMVHQAGNKMVLSIWRVAKSQTMTSLSRSRSALGAPDTKFPSVKYATAPTPRLWPFSLALSAKVVAQKRCTRPSSDPAATSRPAKLSAQKQASPLKVDRQAPVWVSQNLTVWSVAAVASFPDKRHKATIMLSDFTVVRKRPFVKMTSWLP